MDTQNPRREMELRPLMNPGNCIPPENLSAELDGEYHFSPEDKKHLESCAKCRALYDSYRIIDDAASNALAANCPATAQYRIRHNVNRYLDAHDPAKQHRSIHFSTWIARAAAVALIASIGGYLIFVDSPFGEETQTAQTGSVRQQQNTPADNPARWDSEPASYPHFTSGAVDIGSLRLASDGANQSLSFTGALEPKVKAEKIALIPSQIKHIWLIDRSWSAGKVENLFRNALRQNDVSLTGLKWRIDSDGTIRATVSMTARQAVTVVRALSAEKLQLVSAAQPQPEQRLFAGTGKEKTLYEAVFMPRGK